MNQSVERRLAELVPIARGDSVLDALAVAIAVEDSFGIVLGDADLTADRLCSAAALNSTVKRYLSRQ